MTALLLGLTKTVLLLLSTALLAYVLLCAWLYATQRGQIYFPTPETDHPNAEVLWIDSEGERIKVWAVQRPGRKAFIYFGGNADDAALHIDGFAAALPEHSLYLVNYRGYGGSSGRPSEAALFADALLVHDAVRKRHADIVVLGRSLGSGVGVYLAAERPVSKLVLVTPFDSLVNVAGVHNRWLPVRWLMRDRYDAASRAPAVAAPVLLVVAGEDEIIPRARSEALAAAFRPGQAEVRIIEGAGHNTLDGSPRYLEAVREFLDSE